MSRRLTIPTMLAGVLTLIIPAAVGAPIKLIWNASRSVPIGLYELVPPTPITITDLVAVSPPEPIAVFLAERGYLAAGAPLLKHIAALPGQEVCRFGDTVTVDGVPFGDALDRDSQGRPLPVWQGCRRMAGDEVFLMNPSVPDSLDGRYFGALPASTIIGKAIPLYTDEEGDGRFVWRAATR